MRIKTLAIVAVLGVFGAPGLANAVPAAPSSAQGGISQQPEFLPVRDGSARDSISRNGGTSGAGGHRRCTPFRGGPGPWSGGTWRVGPRGGPYWGPGWGGPYYNR